MNTPLLLSIVAAGFAVAFFHAAIPTHWLPFVLTARVQGWSKARTLGVTAIAGSGHVAFTTLLGVLIVWAGMQVDHLTGSVFPWIAGGVLFAFGVFFLVRQAMGAGHSHIHLMGGHKHDHAHRDHDHGDHDHHHHAHLITETRDVTVSRNRVSDRTAILSLFTLLTFSPCEGFLPVYVSLARFGWQGFAAGSVTLALATIAGMMTFTSLTLAGVERLNLKFLERYESAILGTVLCLLGIAIVLVEG